MPLTPIIFLICLAIGIVCLIYIRDIQEIV